MFINIFTIVFLLYLESGGNCTDIDECLSPQSCLYGTCVNTQGGYKCECPVDYELVSEGNACVGMNYFYIYIILKLTTRNPINR